MAQLQFEKEYSGDHEITHLVVKNPNGRIWFSGWDRPDIRVTARIEVPGSQVPDDITPRIEEEDHVMTIKCGQGTSPIHDEIDVQGIVENVVNIGEEVRDSVENIVSSLVQDLSGATDKTKESESSRKHHISMGFSMDDLNDLPEKLRELKEKVVEKTRAASDRFENHSLNSTVRTDLEILVPMGLSIRARSMNGIIGCESFQGTVDFKATNGQVRLKSVTGKMELRSMNGLLVLEGCHPEYLRAKSLNGPIKASFTRVSGEIYLKTLNGPVRAVFPTSSDLALEVRTTSSPVKVASGFQTEMRSQRRFTGSLGKGDNEVRIKTVSGPVTVVLSGDPVPQPASSEEAESLKAVL